YKKLLKARNHGLKNRDECEFWSLNSRLDAIQAAILNVKLKYLDKWTEKRRKNAQYYIKKLRGLVELPLEKTFEKCVYHTFVIQTYNRDGLKTFLENKGIETKIHYPIPIHLQQAAKDLGCKKGNFPETERQLDRMLSLPIYAELPKEMQEEVVKRIREFKNKDGK
ncbi:MAG: DegT/DnrJ/EryC1/StrS family aminotransferase, partial [Candidatus Altiarchaeales archaeon]|nr:DegT/DnrJ/EryC1/StrS family aminotransferase [Candidatus Altiarchaeales archaeon]